MQLIVNALNALLEAWGAVQALHWHFQLFQEAPTE